MYIYNSEAMVQRFLVSSRVYFLRTGLLVRDRRLRDRFTRAGDGLLLCDLFEWLCRGDRWCLLRWCLSRDRDRASSSRAWWWWRWRCRLGEGDRCRDLLDEDLCDLDDRGGEDAPAGEAATRSLLPRSLPIWTEGEPGSESVGARCTSASLPAASLGVEARLEPLLASGSGPSDGAEVSAVATGGASLIMLRNLASRFLRSSCS